MTLGPYPSSRNHPSAILFNDARSKQRCFFIPVIDKDLEKGESGAQENNEVDQGSLDRRRTKEEDNVVGWDGPEDSENPQNWSHSRKYTVTVLYTLNFTLTFASSVFITATVVTAELYGVSDEVMILGTSLFVLVSTLHDPSLRTHC